MKALVVAELERRKGDLRAIAAESGVAYDTVLRIKNGEGDPGYSKVARLAATLFEEAPGAPPTPSDTTPHQETQHAA